VGCEGVGAPAYKCAPLLPKAVTVLGDGLSWSLKLTLEPRQSLRDIYRVHAPLPRRVQRHRPDGNDAAVDRREAGSEVVKLAHQLVVPGIARVDDKSRDVGVAGHLLPHVLQVVEVDATRSNSSSVAASSFPGGASAMPLILPGAQDSCLRENSGQPSAAREAHASLPLCART